MGIWDSLKIRFFGPSDKPDQPTNAPGGSVQVPVNDYRIPDHLEGYEFSATLQIRTPLEVLRHHGELFRGPLDQAPKYGTWTEGGYSADGIWVPKTKSWAELAREAGGNVEAAARMDRETPESTYASDIGPTTPSKYLPFLLDFRDIVEGEGEAEEKIERVKALGSTHRAIYKRVQGTYPDFPEGFFLGKPKRTRRKAKQATEPPSEP